MVVEGKNAKVIYVEVETNIFPIYYAKVKEVILDKDKINLVLSPTDLAVKEYATTGPVGCEVGDIISYNLIGEKGKEAVRIKEIYRTKFIGFKGDLVVESVQGDEVYLTNGESFNRKENVIKVNGQEYKIFMYYTMVTRVRREGDGWVFASTDFEDFRNVRFSPGDRIAIDEIEDVIVIYSGYEEE